jgi:hypothetical protein
MHLKYDMVILLLIYLGVLILLIAYLGVFVVCVGAVRCKLQRLVEVQFRPRCALFFSVSG